MSEMFCFQCQQTAGGSGCVRTGVCGKQPETANLQDSLVCRLIRLAELCEEQNQHPKEVTRLLADGLFTTLTNVNFDNEAIRAFTERVEQQLHRRNVQADILEYESGETFLEAARKAPFTAAFLDIYMDGMTGMEAAKKLRKTNTDCLLVFTTTSTDHALEGFQVRALHYLVKPFTEADIDVLTDELLARIPRPDKYMELKVEGSEIHLRYQDIVYAEHFAHLIYVHTTVQKTLATRQPFKTFIAPLKDDTRFFVCGRGVIVNLEHAKDLEGAAFRMADGSRVFVSQDLLKSARQAFMEFLLQRGRMA